MKKVPLDDALREAIRLSGKTLNGLSIESGVQSGALSRFMRQERGIGLRSAAKIADTLHLQLGMVQFFRKPEQVTSELEDMASSANFQIRTIGGRSRNTSYLAAIERAVHERSVNYDRLFFGRPGTDREREDHGITHELHEHLAKLVDLPSVRIRVAPSYFVPLTVADNEALLFLGAGQKEDFYGIQFPGYGYGLLFSQYFSLVFDAYDADEFQVRRAEDLEKYCECQKGE